MYTTIAQLTRIMQMVFYTRANSLAHATGFMERERILTGSSFIVGLVSGWQSNPCNTLAGLSQAVGNAGTPITRQGLARRFTTEAVGFIKAMLEETLTMVVKGGPQQGEVFGRFSRIELVDSSIITLPNSLAGKWRGSGGFGENASVAAAKISVRWDMKSGELATLELSDGIMHDRQSVAHQAPVEAGSLHIRDQGYFKIDDFAAIEAQGAFWLTRYKVRTILLDPETGQQLPLTDWLPQRVGDRIDTPVLLGQSKQLPCRLVAERVPKTVVQQRHARIRETARQNQTDPSPLALAMAHWTLYLTNVPPERLAPEEVFVMGCYRWQIELLFKLWKSYLHIDEWRSDDPCRILCELYAKLIVAIVSHWFLLMACWSNPRHSLMQAMPSIHGIAMQWANSLHDTYMFEHALRSLQRALSKCQMDKCSSRPRHFELLEAFSSDTFP